MSPGGGLDHAGSASVEAALVLPAVMVALLLVIQLCLWAHADAVAGVAAAAGEQAAALDGGSAAAAGQAATTVLDGPGRAVLSAGAVTVAGAPDDVVSVTVTGRAEPVLPWLALPVTATRRGPTQEFRP